MALKIKDILRFPELDGVHPVVPAVMDRQVRWVHTWPEVLPWLHGGELLLTTAYSWPQDPNEQRRIVREIHQAGVAAILFRAGGEFFPAIPTAVVEEADRAGLAVLEATQDVSFVDLTEAINRAIIRTHFEALERSERIQRELTEAALEADSASHIVARLERLLGRNVLVVDRRGRLLAGDENLFRQLPVLPDSDSHRADRRVEAIGGGWVVLWQAVRTGAEVVARLVLLAAPEEPFRDVDFRVAEHAALVMGLHFLRQQAVADAEARVRSTFVEALLQGRLSGDPALRERAQLLGFDPEIPHTVAVVVPVGLDGRAVLRPLESREEFQTRHRLGEAVEHAFRSLRLAAFTAFELNQVLVLLPAILSARPAREQLEAFYALLRAQLPDLPVVVAVGRPQQDPARLRTSLEEAQATLSVARTPGLWWYEDALVLRILHACQDRAALEALYASTLGRLREANPVLYETARALVATGFNQRAAARTLGVCRRTCKSAGI